MKEIWKDIKGYEGYYQVSNLGNVKSLDRYITYNSEKNFTRFKKGQPVAQIIKRSGYKYVGLNKDGKFKSHTLHRLMAIAFLPNPLNKKTVNHIDSNKLNNTLENLEWATYLENNIHCIKYGKRKFVVDEKRVIKLYRSGYTMKQVAKKMDISTSTVYNILHLNKVKTRKQGKKGVYFKLQDTYNPKG